MCDMTDPIPQVLLDEALRRLSENAPSLSWDYSSHSVQTLARTLQELGWEPPVDPMLVKAREIVATFYRKNGAPLTAARVEQGEQDGGDEVRIALIALREGMGKW